MCNSEHLYYENQLKLQKHDLRKFWKIMKEIIGKVNKSDENNFECIILGSLAKDVQQIAKAFNNYFYGNWSKLGKQDYKQDQPNVLHFVKH